MGFLDVFKKKTKEEQQVEKQKEENKAKLLGEIKALIRISDELIKKLENKLSTTRDNMIISSINKAKNQLEQTKTHLEEAYPFLNVLNISSTLDELNKAEKSINMKSLSEDIIDYLVKVGVLPRRQRDKEKIIFIRSDIERLIRNLPDFNF